VSRVTYRDIMLAMTRAEAETLAGRAAQGIDTFEDAAELAGLAWVSESMPADASIQSRVAESSWGRSFRERLVAHLLFRWESRARWRIGEQVHKRALQDIFDRCAETGVPMTEGAAQVLLAQLSGRGGYGRDPE
jgi:hypothetical protein